MRLDPPNFSGGSYGALRRELDHGDGVDQPRLDEVLEQLRGRRELLRPGEKDEVFQLVDADGKLNGLIAPRWLCHFLGLRHRSVHILLKWKSPGLGTTFVLQVRGWGKSDSAGHLDISVGGHVLGSDGESMLASAFRELEEELGISRHELRGETLVPKGGYRSYDEDESGAFFNAEWREVYVGEVDTEGFEKLHFSDREVSGLYICPASDARELLQQKVLPIASALECSLPRCL